MRLKIITSTGTTVIDHITRALLMRDVDKRALAVLTFDNGQPGDTEWLYDGTAYLLDDSGRCILTYDNKRGPTDSAVYTVDETDKDVTIKRTGPFEFDAGPAKHFTAPYIDTHGKIQDAAPDIDASVLTRAINRFLKELIKNDR